MSPFRLMTLHALCSIFRSVLTVQSWMLWNKLKLDPIKLSLSSLVTKSDTSSTCPCFTLPLCRRELTTIKVGWQGTLPSSLTRISPFSHKSFRFAGHVIAKSRICVMCGNMSIWIVQSPWQQSLWGASWTTATLFFVVLMVAQHAGSCATYAPNKWVLFWLSHQLQLGLL